MAGNLSDPVTVSAEFEPPEIEFTKSSSDWNENDNTVRLELELSHAIDQDVSVSFRNTYDIPTQYDVAIKDMDFKLPDFNSATIVAGDVNGFINITLMDDSSYELKEVIHIKL
ncbi:MAG: hypothetical protein OMM_11960, partial [Candidatus Magnetoglobus multicellularis str. Araruama]